MPLLKLKIYTFEKKIEFLDELPLAATLWRQCNLEPTVLKLNNSK